MRNRQKPCHRKTWQQDVKNSDGRRKYLGDSHYKVFSFARWKKKVITVFMWFTVQWIQKPSNQFNNFSFSSRKQHIINWPLWTALGYPKHYGKYGLYLPNRMISKIGPVGIGKFVYTFPHSISSQQSKRYISALG